jgi:NAD-dependent dihydropyrimidine dehydrogenase PreA subunit
MAYIIAEPCIGTKDTACVDVCPVDCIHPAKGRTYDDGRPTFDEVPQLYIDPTECMRVAAPHPPAVPRARHPERPAWSPACPGSVAVFRRQ